MNRKAIIVIFLVVIALIVVSSTSCNYFFRQKSSEKETKSPKNKKKETETQVSEEDLIKQAIINCIKSQGLDPAKFDIADIKYKDNWATGSAVSIDQSMEGALFILQKKNGKWQTIDFGTGIEHSDYPQTPPEIW